MHSDFVLKLQELHLRFRRPIATHKTPKQPWNHCVASSHYYYGFFCSSFLLSVFFKSNMILYFTFRPLYNMSSLLETSYSSAPFMQAKFPLPLQNFWEYESWFSACPAWKALLMSNSMYVFSLFITLIKNWLYIYSASRR